MIPPLAKRPFFVHLKPPFPYNFRTPMIPPHWANPPPGTATSADRIPAPITPENAPIRGGNQSRPEPSDSPNSGRHRAREKAPDPGGNRDRPGPTGSPRPEPGQRPAAPTTAQGWPAESPKNGLNRAESKIGNADPGKITIAAQPSHPRRTDRYKTGKRGKLHRTDQSRPKPNHPRRRSLPAKNSDFPLREGRTGGIKFCIRSRYFVKSLNVLILDDEFISEKEGN